MQVDEPEVLELPAGQAVHVDATALLNVFGKQAVHKEHGPTGRSVGLWSKQGNKRHATHGPEQEVEPAVAKLPALQAVGDVKRFSPASLMSLRV